VYIVGDIGGTNSRLQAFAVRGDWVNDEQVAGDSKSEDKLIAEKTYPSQDASSLTDIMRKFIAEEIEHCSQPIGAGLVVAGPVMDNTAEITNLEWVIDGDKIAEDLGMMKCNLVNDFSGIGLGLLMLNKGDVYTVHEAPCIPHAPIAVIGAGTGLGEAYLTYNGTEYDVWSSEGGHVDFSPRNPLEMELVQYMSDLIADNTWGKPSALKPKPTEKRQDQDLDDSDDADDDDDDDDDDATDSKSPVADDAAVVLEWAGPKFASTKKRTCALGTYARSKIIRVSNERIVSGTGLPHIYGFLRAKFPDRVNSEVDQEVMNGKSAAVIAEHAAKGDDRLCEETMRMFVSAYGSESGNLALKTLPYGGLYVAGGIAPKIIKLMKRDNLFWEHMVHKGRMSNLLRKVPVYVVKGTVEVGLMGAQVLARRTVRNLALRGEIPAHFGTILQQNICTEPLNRTTESDPMSRYRFKSIGSRQDYAELPSLAPVHE
jgi:glucokinase